MYWFLALVLKEDVLSGEFWPSYILCKSPVTSTERTGLRVTRIIAGEPARSTPKLLVTELTGHEDLVRFLSVFQAHGVKEGHYHPEGSLCWFGCNRYGEPTGEVVYIRDVPIKSLMWDFKQKREYRMSLFNKERTLPEVISKDDKSEILPDVKTLLYQKPGQKINTKGKKRYGCNKKGTGSKRSTGKRKNLPSGNDNAERSPEVV